METMQISLIQALAPEPSAPEPERTDEFSSILSGQEAETKAESPPGQPPPPVQKPAVEEAEKQEPNAQSQKPDFHCNDEAKPDGRTPGETVDVPHQSIETDGETKSKTETAASTPQMAAQTALAWIGMLPEPVIAQDIPTPNETVATVAIDPVDIPTTGEPIQLQPGDHKPQPATKPTLYGQAEVQVPAEQTPASAQTQAASPSVVDSSSQQVQASELYKLVEDSRAEIEVVAQPEANLPKQTETAPVAPPVQNAKVQQAVKSSEPAIVVDPARTSVVTGPISEPVEQTVADKGKEDKSSKLVEPSKGTTSEEASIPANEQADVSAAKLANQQKPEPKAVQANPDSRAHEPKAATVAEPAKKAEMASNVQPKAQAEVKPIEKPQTAPKAEPLHKAETARSEQPATTGGQTQTGDDQTQESETEETQIEPVRTANIQQTRQDFKVEASQSPATTKLEPIDAKKTAEVVRQIVDRVETIAATHRPGGVVIRLNPEDLGTITMAVKSIGDQVEAHIVASDDRVRTALDTSRSQLAQAIEAKGFSLKSVTVTETQSTQTQSQLANQGRSQSQQQDRQDQQALRQQSNMWTYAHGNSEATAQRGGFTRATTGGLDLWT